MRGPIRLIEIAGVVLLLIVLAVVGSRVSAESGATNSAGSSDLAGLVSRLRMAGLTVAVEGEVHDPRLAGFGTRLTVDGETVDVYAYDDAWSAEVGATRLINDHGGGPTDWIDAPHLFHHDRLLIIHSGGSDKLNSLLSSLLEDGANLHERR